VTNALVGSKIFAFTIVANLAVLAWGTGWWLSNAGMFSPGSSSIALFAGMAIALITGWDFLSVRSVIRVILPTAIILLGLGLDLSGMQASEIGLTGVAAILATAVMSFGIAFLSAKWLRVPLPIAMTIGAGGAICGNAAVLAVAPLVRLKHEEVAVVLAAINLLGLSLFVVVVGVTNVLGMDPAAAGIWAGAAIHAVPQAIAAGEAIGPDGQAIATAVKVSRVSLLVAVVPLFSVLGRRIRSGQPDANRAAGRRSGLGVPWFVPGFVIAAIVGNLLLPGQASDVLSEGGRVVLLPVLAAVGLGVSRSTLRQTGGRVFIVGGLCALGLTLASLAAVLVLYD
jgi:uncharacterized integral membrane protein (TIGR00698 family)